MIMCELLSWSAYVSKMIQSSAYRAQRKYGSYNNGLCIHVNSCNGLCTCTNSCDGLRTYV